MTGRDQSPEPVSDVECPTCGGPTEDGHALEGWPFEWEVERRFDHVAQSCERRLCGYTSYTVCPVNGCHRRAGDYERPHNHPNPVLAALADSEVKE